METLFFKKHSQYAVIPKRQTPGSAGYDLSSAETCIVPAHGKYLVNTDLSVCIPHTYYGRIAPRSSIAYKGHISVGAGVIDEDYTGVVKVLLFNHSNTDYNIQVGDRIAQLIIEKYLECNVKVVDSLNETKRLGGFGSTGT